MNYNRGSILSDAPAVKNLIILNIIVFAAQMIIKDINLTELGSMHYFKSEYFKPFQIVTSMFMHSNISITHIIFNMFGLYVFGSILERVWGSKKFLFFYLVCGIGANLFQQVILPFEAQGFIKYVLRTTEAASVDIDLLKQSFLTQYSSLGASGAITGLMVAFAYLFPNTELMMMFIPVPIKAKILVPILIAIDLFGGIYKLPGDNIAHFAHLGGALIGFLLVFYWNKTNKKTFY
jgi:membrane associated rhomboid family serine protease